MLGHITLPKYYHYEFFLLCLIQKDHKKMFSLFLAGGSVSFIRMNLLVLFPELPGETEFFLLLVLTRILESRFIPELLYNVCDIIKTESFSLEFQLSY